MGSKESFDCHFSVDDVLDCLLDVSDSCRDPFEHPILGFLKGIHERFAIEVDLYLFYGEGAGGRGRSLADVASRLRPIFQAHPWIRWGPHALDHATPPHTQPVDKQRSFCDATYAEIARFAGDHRTSRWVRLHYFSEAIELASYFRNRGVEALLTTDKPAVSYRLPPPETDRLRCQGEVEYGGIRFVRSQLRMENLVGLDDGQLEASLENHCPAGRCAVVFTHEYELARPEVRETTIRALAHLEQRAAVRGLLP